VSRRGSILAALAVMAVTVALPSIASGHAYLTSTAPAASVVLSGPPAGVQLTFDEPVEPRFAIISVTDAAGTQDTTGPVTRSPSNPDTLSVPVRAGLPEGWYLVYWRAISVDGHPVQGAFTYAVGPNPGPAPQFQVPSVSASAATPQLLITRWIMLVSVMTALGLLALRLLIARPVLRRLPGTSLRAVSTAFAVSAVVGVIAIPVYLDLSVAGDSLRSAFDLGALVPLFRVTAFSRGLLDLELCFGLFCLAGAIAVWVDRPDRPRRSVAELSAGAGAVLAGVATVLVPGAIGHAGQASPRGYSLVFDWVHVAAGSLWLGGLVGLLVLWVGLTESARPAAPARVEVLAVVVPRFSNLALGSVLLLMATGTGATIIHMPALNALWDTGYGVAILVKIGILLAATALGAVNLLRTRPALLAARERVERGASSARLLRRLIGVETVLVCGAVFAAAVLSSLAPPPPSFALQSSALATVGPGRVVRTVARNGFVLQVVIAPNKAATPDSFTLRITRNGRPVRGASVTLALNHTEMQMPQQDYQLSETSPGVYSRSAPALVMVGRWGLAFQIAPPSGSPFTALIVDQAGG
jgi:copper transport protein